MRFVKLSEPEILTLQEGHKNGSQFQFRNRCFCLLLSHQGKTVTELTEFFGVSRITVYSWFEAWEAGGICGLMNKPGRGRKPILSLQNPKHVSLVKKAAGRNPQSVKSMIAELEPKIGSEMHPETVRRFLKNLITASVASEPASSQSKWVLKEKKKKRR
jgi:transposase